MTDLDPIWLVLGCALIWSGLGVLASVWFRRRGHNFMMFAGLAIWMGPLIILLMRSVVTQQHKPVRLMRTGAPFSGWIDVLVGIDGSDASTQSIRAAITTLAPAIRRLRIVTVLDPETANNPGAFATDDTLEVKLAAAADELGFEHAELAFVSGRADLALIEHAEAEGFEIVVVSHRHRSVWSAILGSTVDRLARNASVSVLIGPPAPSNGDRPSQQHLPADPQETPS